MWATPIPDQSELQSAITTFWPEGFSPAMTDHALRNCGTGYGGPCTTQVREQLTVAAFDCLSHRYVTFSVWPVSFLCFLYLFNGFNNKILNFICCIKSFKWLTRFSNFSRVAHICGFHETFHFDLSKLIYHTPMILHQLNCMNCQTMRF